MAVNTYQRGCSGLKEPTRGQWVKLFEQVGLYPGLLL